MEKAIAYLDTGEMPPLWESDTVLLSEDEEDEEPEVRLLLGCFPLVLLSLFTRFLRIRNKSAADGQTLL